VRAGVALASLRTYKGSQAGILLGDSGKRLSGKALKARVWALRDRGYSIEKIAQLVGFGKDAIRKIVRADTEEARVFRRYPIDRHKPGGWPEE